MKRLIAIAAAALIVIAGAIYWQTGQAPELPTLAMAEAQTADAVDVDKSLVVEMTLGQADAPLTVVEYASFTCPHCRHFHETTFGDFKTNYIDTGKVHFIYREVYFDRFGLWAGMVARCGGGAKYFPISDLIYTQQSDWTQGSGPAEIAGNLARIGRTAGFSTEEMDACMQDVDMARALIAVYEENSQRDGIHSTPSFLIGGDLVSGAMGYEEFSSLLDAKLDG